MVASVEFESTTQGLEIPCSILLSYEAIISYIIVHVYKVVKNYFFYFGLGGWSRSNGLWIPSPALYHLSYTQTFFSIFNYTINRIWTYISADSAMVSYP